VCPVCAIQQASTMASALKKIGINLQNGLFCRLQARDWSTTMQAATISPVYVKSALLGAIRKGYNPEEILQAQGLPPEILTNPKLRISTLAFAELTRTLTELLRDETGGLLAKPSQLGTFKLLARACLSSKDIKESLYIWRDMGNYLDDSTQSFTQLEKDNPYIAINCKIADGIEDNYILESLLTICHRFHCWLAGEFIPIERVDLAFPEPSFSEEHRFVFYGAPVNYNQKQNAIYFSRKTLEIQNYRTRDDLREMFKKPHVNLLTQPRQSKSVSIKIRLWMEKLFREGGGLPQLDEASEHMGLTEQTLRRRLKADGYSFNKLKEDTRRDMAIYYIKQSDLSVEEIGFRLGFSEASTFIRAFKKWTGLTPLAYRKL
jgi:AraC-like DNA-binding protein